MTTNILSVKKLLSILMFFLLLQTKSQAQTQFPFYGFELSNYEVGDSLEYEDYSSSLISNSSMASTTLYKILKKEFLSIDSIKFTVQINYYTTINSYQHYSYFGKDTI